MSTGELISLGININLETEWPETMLARLGFAVTAREGREYSVTESKEIRVPLLQ